MTAKDYIQEQYYWFQTYSYWFGTYPYWVIGYVAPGIVAHPDRQFIVQAESRELEVESENRGFVVQSENRELEVSDERHRIYVVPVEDRTDDIG